MASDVSTGRRSQTQETGFGGLQALVGGNEGPGWIGLVILIGWN